jgi:hypothetical protein
MLRAGAFLLICGVSALSTTVATSAATATDWEQQMPPVSKVLADRRAARAERYAADHDRLSVRA